MLGVVHNSQQEVTSTITTTTILSTVLEVFHNSQQEIIKPNINLVSSLRS